jgi:hypothetical protein
LPDLKKSIVVGVDLIHEGRNKILACTASYSPAITKYFSKIYIQEGVIPPKEEIHKRDYIERKSTEIRAELLSQFLTEALNFYQKGFKGILPEKIVIYRDGIGGPTWKAKVLDYEVDYLIKHLQSFV